MRIVGLRLFLAIGLALAPSAAWAQSAIEGRVDRLEREVRAVQRKVFPGGNGQYFEPDIAPPTGSPASPGTPATNPVTDLNGRVNALEAQVAQTTGQVEQMQYRLRQIEDAFAAYKRSTDARLSALEQTASTPVAGVLATPAGTPPARPAVAPPVSRSGAAPPRTPAATAPAPDASTHDPARTALLAGIERPSSDDPAEDGYNYGYRLWQAKLYPESEAALKDVVARYPNHRRASYAQNLLGRAYLEENKPSVAAIAFYQNYRTNPRGERAPDSLYYLAQALVKLKKPQSEVCKVYDELNDAYGSTMSEQLKADTARGRAASNCR